MRMILTVICLMVFAGLAQANKQTQLLALEKQSIPAKAADNCTCSDGSKCTCDCLTTGKCPCKDCKCQAVEGIPLEKLEIGKAYLQLGNGRYVPYNPPVSTYAPTTPIAYPAQPNRSYSTPRFRRAAPCPS